MDWVILSLDIQSYLLESRCVGGPQASPEAGVFRGSKHLYTQEVWLEDIGCLHPGNLTWIPKIAMFKGSYQFQGPSFGGSWISRVCWSKKSSFRLPGSSQLIQKSRTAISFGWWNHRWSLGCWMTMISRIYGRFFGWNPKMEMDGSDGFSISKGWSLGEPCVHFWEDTRWAVWIQLIGSLSLFLQGFICLSQVVSQISSINSMTMTVPDFQSCKIRQDVRQMSGCEIEAGFGGGAGLAGQRPADRGELKESFKGAGYLEDHPRTWFSG